MARFPRSLWTFEVLNRPVQLYRNKYQNASITIIYVAMAAQTRENDVCNFELYRCELEYWHPKLHLIYLEANTGGAIGMYDKVAS